MLTEERYNAISAALAADLPIASIVVLTGVSEETIIEVAHSTSFNDYKANRRNSTKHRKRVRSAGNQSNNAVLQDIKQILMEMLELWKGEQK